MEARLASETDLAGFREEARSLLAHQVPPEAVHWRTTQNNDLLADAQAAQARAGTHVPRAAMAIVPASFLRLCEVVVLHSDPGRFALLYRLLWRLVHEPALRNDPVDADMLAAQQMAQAVRRDLHRMKSFVRLRPVDDGRGPDSPLHLAWFDPGHHIVEAAGPWFARRFPALRWAILTPERSVRWTPAAAPGEAGRLEFGPGLPRGAAPSAHAGDASWLAAYRRVFNAVPPAAAAPLPAPPRTDRIFSLEQLKAATERCRECPIGEHATQSVIGEGPRKAVLMLVGEQPGDQEDLRGHPFVGPAGQLLDRALERVGIPRGQVFVSNAVKHFKFELRGKRRIHKTPTQREAAACLHWLEDEIELVRPQALVALGATAARSLMGQAVPVTAERGHWLTRADGRQVLITLHPSALLRVPVQDRDAAFELFVQDLGQARPLFKA